MLWADFCKSLFPKQRQHTQEEGEIYKKFTKELFNEQKPLDAEIAKVVNDNFWDLIGD